MAPARMMQFIDQHIKDCEICHDDMELPEEIEKIREFILPDSKIPKAYRTQNKPPTPEISPVGETKSGSSPILKQKPDKEDNNK